VVEEGRERFVLTAANCLPRLPKPNRHRDTIHKNLLSPLNNKQQPVWAECLFVEPVSDLAVLTKREIPQPSERADAYDELVDPAASLRIGGWKMPESLLFPAWLIPIVQSGASSG
jgi:hypothetical protein